jgi:succinoglycan biosynthesis transport protein ExoP
MNIFSFTRWIRIALSVFVLTVLGGYILISLQPKVYTARAQIQIRETDLGNLPDGSFEPEFQIIQSPDVLGPIIQDLGLDQKWARRIYKSDEPALSPQAALAYLRGNLKLDCVRGTNIIDITVSSDVPEEAAQIANAIADRYKTMRDVEEAQRKPRGSDAIHSQIAGQEKVVAEKQAALDQAKQNLAAQGIDIGSAQAALSNLEKLKRDLAGAVEDYQARRALIDAAKNLPDDQYSTTLQSLGQSGDIGPVQARIAELKTEISNLLKSGFSENDPAVVALQTELQSKVKQRADLISGLRRAMQIDADMAQSRVALLQKQVDTAQAACDEMGQGPLKTYGDAEHELKNAQDLLDALNVRLKQLLIDAQLTESPVAIISRAEPPSAPARPNVRFDLFLSALAGLVLGPLVATAVEILHPRRRVATRP